MRLVAFFGSAPNITRRDGDSRTGGKGRITRKEDKSFRGVTSWSQGGDHLLLRMNSDHHMGRQRSQDRRDKESGLMRNDRGNFK